MKWSRLSLDIITLALILWGTAVHALEPFPFAEEVQQSVSDEPDYRIVLSGVTAGQGEPRVERDYRVAGKVERHTLEITSDRTPREAFDHYRAQAELDGYDLVFECHGRDCGDSATWAAQIFRQPQLYGFSRDQHYFVAVKRAEGKALMVYAIRRGNQRVYVHWERVSTGQPLDIRLTVNLRDTALLGSELDSISEIERKIRPLMDARESGDYWVIVSWSRKPGASLRQNMRTARSQAQLIRDILTRRLGPDTRTEIHVMGPFGPEYLFAQEDRVVSIHRTGEAP